MTDFLPPELSDVREALAEFYTPEQAELWLGSPHRLLGGDTPRTRILMGFVDDVWALIEQIQTGAFV